jgi:putative endonuclease
MERHLAALGDARKVESGRAFLDIANRISLLRHSRESGNPGPMRNSFSPTVYILASRRNGTIYTGVTSDPTGRIYRHRSGMIDGFTRQYEVKLLVWFELHATMEGAILREKRIKKWNRAWKLELIERSNPDWRDLAEDFGFAPLEGKSGFPLSRE